jgi:hypothetical protein
MEKQDSRINTFLFFLGIDPHKNITVVSSHPWAPRCLALGAPSAPANAKLFATARGNGRPPCHSSQRCRRIAGPTWHQAATRPGGRWLLKWLWLALLMDKDWEIHQGKRGCHQCHQNLGGPFSTGIW